MIAVVTQNSEHVREAVSDYPCIHVVAVSDLPSVLVSTAVDVVHSKEFDSALAATVTFTAVMRYDCLPQPTSVGPGPLPLLLGISVGQDQPTETEATRVQTAPEAFVPSV